MKNTKLTQLNLLAHKVNIELNVLVRLCYTGLAAR